ncbi:uncharacterized protein YjbI with pentapeptide repeats [Lewinella aquimaris]|uniref:Uncharacterized protein YjbI with pentapeptide repeats n=1 Tax=Neolewinella aquimaris TaxID=1835722 RepID=A0A840EBP5_9BACT|nr:pentapeptide repeat-containing protein [Neolewinella aquimaris]MBB4081122.1 uncharacterized protein YjbI with pentapeptide repeats [Neolewinella aquimaris]
MLSKIDKFFLRYFVITKNLEKSILDLYEKGKSEKSINKDDIGQLLLAVKVRLIKFYVGGIIIAAIPTLLSVWLLSNQNSILARQTEFFEKQFIDDNYLEYNKIIMDNSKSASEREYAARQLITIGEKLRENNSFRRVNFRSSHLDDVDLTGLDLTGINFDQASLSGSNLKGQVLTRCSFNQATLIDVDCEGATFYDCSFHDAFAGTYLDSKIRDSKLRLRYPNYNMNTINGVGLFKGVTFSKCNLDSWKVNFVDFRGAIFENCNWNANGIVREQVYGSIFINTSGLSESVLEKLQENGAIVTIADIDYHLSEAKRLLSEARNEPELYHTETGLSLAVDFYRELRSKVNYNNDVREN